MTNVIETCQVVKCREAATETYRVNLGLDKEVWVIVIVCKKHIKLLA